MEYKEDAFMNIKRRDDEEMVWMENIFESAQGC